MLNLEHYHNEGKKYGMSLNPNQERVELVLKGLQRNATKDPDGKAHCPCSLERGDHMVCPCETLRTKQECHCNLFVL